MALVVNRPSELGECRFNCLTPTPTAWARRGITTYARTPLAWRLNNHSDNPQAQWREEKRSAAQADGQ